MKIVLNGDAARGADRITVAGLVRDDRRRAVRRPRHGGRGRCRGRAAQRVGRRSSSTEGQRVEVVGAIQGG